MLPVILIAGSFFMMKQEVDKALQTLLEGGIILYPTDTVWGIGCDATNVAAVKKIYALKQRSDTKSMIALLAEPKEVFKYVARPHPDILHLLKQFEQPTTVIYPQAIGLADNLVNQDGSIAMRVTKDPFCKVLLKRLKKPLVSTSANISGRPTPANYSSISPAIIQGVDYVVQWRQEQNANPSPSRIIRILDSGEIEIIRP